MNTAPTLSTKTASMTALRRLIQSRHHDPLIASCLRRHFDPKPADAILRHRVPQKNWRDGQLDGAAFHANLIDALRAKIRPHDTSVQLQPALRLLARYDFTLLPEVRPEELVLSDTQLGLHGMPDLVGWCGSRRAMIEIKTVHDIPVGYPYLEHSVQTSALFQIAWGHAPHSKSHFVRVLYVQSTAPYAAYLLPVQMPNVFCNVARELAASLRN